MPLFVRFRTYLALRHFLALLLHVSVPVFFYNSVNAQLLLALSARVCAPFCSDFALTREINEETWSALSDEFSVWQYTSPYTCTSLDMRNKKNIDKIDSMHFCFFPTPPPFFLLFCNVLIVLWFRFTSKRASGSLLHTCSGKFALITPGDVVHIFKERTKCSQWTPTRKQWF